MAVDMRLESLISINLQSLYTEGNVLLIAVNVGTHLGQQF